MYASANIVIFVNIEDIFNELELLLKKQSVYLCISYDTDILAFENVIGYGQKWITFASKHKNLIIELRTKSANFKAIENMGLEKNVILAWTLSPNKIISNVENKTPCLNDRLLSVKAAIDKGWKVRICFDPILYIKDWQKYYNDLIKTTFSKLPKEKIYDISIGVFRMSKDYLKRIRKKKTNSIIINYPFESIKGVCTYNEKLTQNMLTYIYDTIKEYVPEEKIYL